MENKNLYNLKKEYLNTPIPQELDSLVRKTLENSGIYKAKRNYWLKKIAVTAASAAIFVAILAASVNISPAFASTLSKLPVVNSIVKVLTFKHYSINEDKYKADIKVPSIQGIEDKALESSLNEKYLSEGKELYEQFTADMEKLKANGGGNLGVSSGYVVKTDTDTLLSIGRYVVNTVGSSSTTFKYDTIDKSRKVLLTLPSLFKDERYIDVISENIKKQMAEQMEIDPKKVYWVTIEGKNKPAVTPFNKISKDQNFYINSENKLVISFNKYEVAPGYMGIVEFIIPTDIISDILVGNEYIK